MPLDASVRGSSVAAFAGMESAQVAIGGHTAGQPDVFHTLVVSLVTALLTIPRSRIRPSAAAFPFLLLCSFHLWSPTDERAQRVRFIPDWEGRPAYLRRVARETWRFLTFVDPNPIGCRLTMSEALRLSLRNARRQPHCCG